MILKTKSKTKKEIKAKVTENKNIKLEKFATKSTKNQHNLLTKKITELITKPVSNFDNSVAYFSMEIAISHLIPSYHGGLGILAGDILKSGADLGINMIGIGLFCEYGNFRQSLDEFGNQTDELSDWNPHDFYTLLPQTFTVKIAEKEIIGRIWEYRLKGLKADNPIYFVDASSPQNSPEDQKISYQLYSANEDIWLKQQIFLGIAGVRALEVLGYPILNTYHLNESHDLFVMLELRKKMQNWNEVKKRISFTIHTPLPGAHATLEFEKLANFLDEEEVKMLMEAC